MRLGELIGVLLLLSCTRGASPRGAGGDDDRLTVVHPLDAPAPSAERALCDGWRNPKPVATDGGP
ncbi:MAG: hypothetical protein AB1730_21015 [Myxococcota bacterium]